MRDERIYLNKSTLKPFENAPFLFRISNTKENMFLLQRGLRTYPRKKTINMSGFSRRSNVQIVRPQHNFAEYDWYLY